MFRSWKSPHIKPITFTISLHYFSPPSERWLPLVTHVTPARDPTQSQFTELGWLNTSLGFFQKHNFSERQGTEVSSRDLPRNFFCPRWASPFRFNLAW